MSEEEFSLNFERCFRRLYVYVSRRVPEREHCERIVSEVLAANLALLVRRMDERHELGRLKSSSDRRIESHLVASLATRSGRSDPHTSPSIESKETGGIPCPYSLGSSSV